MTRDAFKIVEVGEHRLAVRRRGSGQPIVLLHGNSCSSRCYANQLDSALADRFELLAIDLPGHGDSAPATAPEATYSLPGYAEALAGAVSALGAARAVFVGWSLGGHVALEATALLPDAAGFLVFGAPPISTLADFVDAATDDPALAVAHREDSTDQEVRALLRLFFRPGYPIPPVFLEDFQRTDPRTRSSLGASAAEGRLRDEAQVVADLGAPLAVLHGVHEAVIKREFLDSVSMPTLWRGAVQDVPEAAHAPHWENPEVFNRLLEEFALDCAGRA